MTWLLYVSLIALVVACAALTPRMKRAGERGWARHQRAVARRRMPKAVTASFEQLRLEMGSVVPAIERFARALEALPAAFDPEEKR